MKPNRGFIGMPLPGDRGLQNPAGGQIRVQQRN
jgi:hypothetical protein